MKCYKVIFATLTRDNMETLPYLVQELMGLGKLFKSFAFVFAENDSSDSTNEYLDRLSKEATYPVVRTGKDFRTKKRPSHSFLARMRNYYLREIYSTKYDDYDYVLIYDADFLHVTSKRGLMDTFSRAGWDVVAALGVKDEKLYDAFAFRNEKFNTPYIPEQYNHSFYQNYVVPQLYERPGLMVEYKNGPLVPVYSAFGGLAIYRKSMLQGLFHDEASEDCEHVSLHQRIRERGGKIFMNPNMRMRYY